MRGSHSCLCSTTWNGQRKTIRNLFAQRQRSGSTCDPIQARTLVLLGARVRKIRGGTEIPTNLKENEMVSHGKMVDIFLCHTSHPIFPATGPPSLGQLRKGRKATTFSKVHSTTRRFSSGACWQAIYCVFTVEFAIRMTLRNQVLTSRTEKHEDHIDLEPEHLTLLTQKQRNMPQARGDSLLQLTENHETLIRKASEQASHVRAVENRQFYITKPF